LPAKPKVVTDGAPGTDTSRAAVSFKEIVDKQRAPDAAPVDDAALETARKEDVTPPARASKPAEGETEGSAWDGDLDKWISTQPKEAIDAFGKRTTDNVNAWLDKEYGDLMPLLVEAGKDGDFRKELRELVKDGKVDREVADFVLGAGIEVARQPRDKDGRFVPTEREAVPAGDPELRKEVTELRTWRDEREKKEHQASYEADLGRQYQALANQFPEVRFKESKLEDPGFALASHLIEVADLKNRAFMAAGSNQRVTLRQVYDEWARTSVKRDEEIGQMRVAPSVTQPGAAASVQPPRDKVESAQRMRDTLKKHGGFANFARAAAVAGRR
jgi:hypothetical protein